MPIRAASRAAAVRDETPILDSTAETWWCTVRSEMNSRCEISRSGRPSESSARTSCSRAVSPAGAARVAARGPARDGPHAELLHPLPDRGRGRVAPSSSNAGQRLPQAASSDEPSRASAAS